MCGHYVYPPQQDDPTGEKSLRNVQAAVDLLQSNSRGLPMVIDNLQLDGSQEQQQQFLSLVVPYLENHPQIQRYAYVSTTDSSSGPGFVDRSNGGAGTATSD